MESHCVFIFYCDVINDHKFKTAQLLFLVSLGQKSGHGMFGSCKAEATVSPGCGFSPSKLILVAGITQFFAVIGL